jgi:hypothetical protein
MILPVWIQDTEQRCCGPEIKIGQSVEWMIYAYLDAIPETKPEAPHISVVADDAVEIVGDWIPQPQWPEEAIVFGAFGDLHQGLVHVGLAIRHGEPPQESPVTFQGQLWHEWHTKRKIPPVKGVVRSIYHHREQLEQTETPGGWKQIGFYDGKAIRSTNEIDPRDDSSWAIRCLLEITG